MLKIAAFVTSITCSGVGLSYLNRRRTLVQNSAGILEGEMGGRRQQTSGRAFAASVGWILALLASYWLISGWENVPRIIASALA